MSGGAAADAIPDAPPAPPVITSAHLIVRGKHATGIAITFSQSMAPATVENTHNYAISTMVAPNLGDDFNFFAGNLTSFKSPEVVEYIAIKAANYDAAMNTVTLIPRTPIRASATYRIQNQIPFPKHPLTSVQGIPLQGTDVFESRPAPGGFEVTLKDGQATSLGAPSAP